MDLVQAVVLGIVQGLTEWLPISSTAHLRVVPALLGWADPGAAFTAVIQLGTLAACLIYFRNDLSKAFKGWIRGLRGERSEEANMGWAILIGTLPIAILGFLFKHQIEGPLRSLYIIASSLIIVGVLMAFAEATATNRRNIDSVRPSDGLRVGMWQAIALIPGASRSGSTITGGLWSGFDRASAARFSFLLSVPSIFAAGIKELYDERKSLLGQSMTPVIVATLVSFVVGYASIAFLMNYLQKRTTTVFIVYRIVLGVFLLVLLARGTLTP